MQTKILYVELKSGYSDNGPAWIGRGEFSKSGRTIYFNGKAFQSCKGQGISANYFDIESGEEYWISGVKKNQQDRHWAGTGKIMIDRTIVSDYLAEVGREKLDSKKFQLIDFSTENKKPRINKLQNEQINR